ncbi:thioredoxin-like 4 [Populus alba x Populus x berolinensis]|nr:thioredoxin-like 4 [Populus alba x Populus x berolinensis]
MDMRRLAECLSCKSRTFCIPRPFSVLEGTQIGRQLDCRIPCVAPSILPCRGNEKSCLMKATFPSITRHAGLNFPKKQMVLWRPGRIKAVVDENPAELSDEDDELWSLWIVLENSRLMRNSLEYHENAEETDSLVVLPVNRDRFLQNCARVLVIKEAANMIEQSEFAERLRIKNVPHFHFYKKGVLVESFPYQGQREDSWSNSEIHFTSSSRPLYVKYGLLIQPQAPVQKGAGGYFITLRCAGHLLSAAARGNYIHLVDILYKRQLFKA